MRKTHYPEIPKQELEKMLDIPDNEIAEKLGTSIYCVKYWRSQYLLPKHRGRILHNILWRKKMDKIEKLLSEKCLITSHDYYITGSYVHKCSIFEELSRRGYRILTIKYRKGGGGRYFRFTLPSTIPRYFIYREKCEDRLVDMLANMIFKRIGIIDQRHIKRFAAVVKEYAEKNHFPEHIADKLASRVEDLLRRSLSQYG
jgi:hypothetical protein